jgi:hypothetical protein
MSAALVLTLMLAQGPPVETGDADQLARVRRALAEAPATIVPSGTPAEGLVFRVTVQGRKPDKLLWDDWSPVPTYIRPWFRGDHHEFLERVTPEEFRSATLYPTGIPVVPIVEFLVKHIKAANRRRGEANAKEEVRQALEAFVACRESPGRPGCH